MLERAVADALRGIFPTLIDYGDNTEILETIYAANAEEVIEKGMQDILKAEAIMSDVRRSGATLQNGKWPFDNWKTPWDAKARWANIQTGFKKLPSEEPRA